MPPFNRKSEIEIRKSICYSEMPPMKRYVNIVALLLSVVWIAGCGAPGAPLPPSLELSRPAEDLAAVRKGNKVYLAWSAPVQTTEGQNVRAKRIGPAQVCRAIAIFPMTSCVQIVGEIPAASVPVAKPGARPQRLTFTENLSEQLEREHPTQFATYAVSMLNWRGRSAGLSNQVRVPLAPVLTPPPEPKANVTPDGIVLAWLEAQQRNQDPVLSYFYRVYRRTEGTNAAVQLGEVESRANATAEFVDRTFQWEKTYFYHVTPVTVVTENGKKIAEVEGDDSPEVKVFAHDIFPPAQPTGLQAVSSGVGQKPFIDLTWAPNTEADLAGYNVYRREDEQAWTKINTELVKVPSYRDQNVQPGRTYYYAVAAVDLRRNESAKSEATSERVP
jgi:hypothetical protein